MSNIDKEWLQQKIADMEATRDEIPFGLDEDDSNTLAALRIALASLEAEPVAWLLSGGGAKNNVSFDSGNAYADPLREVTPLYTAPPAPVSVPAAMEMDDDFDSAFEHGKAVGWNACRAAMLQGADGNSPVIQDGWVMVPVEPTTEMQSAAAGAIRFDTTPINKLWTGNAVYRAMLAAAPQQEVKS
ncbi:TPA: hypothetical protein MPJ72_004463 [Enterobacter asburiae]|nr:hypothetical protein [Enterobacter asburiae]HCA3852070.1 hypothetical protein [Enterobacter asburiae]HDS9625641.1 hypothetical protein [Enterobacter asburiae]HDT1963462.1 hypothetical protein [Enterobacter asburiae]